MDWLNLTDFSLEGTPWHSAVIGHTCGHTEYVNNMQEAIIWVQKHLEGECPNAKR